MKLPLQVVFRNIQPSPAVEAKVRARADKLDDMYDHIMSCRVVVEERHRHHHHGNLFQVGVSLTVPTSELTAHAENEDVYVAIRDSFDAVRRQLENYVCRRRGDVKTRSVQRAKSLLS